MEITIKAVGTKPLLLHSVDLANPLNPWARKMTDLRGTPSKRRTEKWHEEMAYANLMGALYEAPEVDGLALPSENLRRSVHGAAKATRLGETLLRALAVTVANVPIVYDGPRTPQELWDSGNFHLTRMMRSKSSGTAAPTTYPMLQEWAVQAPFELDETVMNIRDLKDLVAKAGRIEGLGASRKQGYGRFDGLVETV